MMPCTVMVTPEFLEERAELEAFVDLSRGCLNTPSRERLECPEGHLHAIWCEPDARVFVPPSFN